MSFNGHFGFLEPFSKEIGFLEPFLFQKLAFRSHFRRKLAFWNHFYFKNWLFGATFKINWLFVTIFISKTGFFGATFKENWLFGATFFCEFQEGFTRTWVFLERIGCLRVPVLVVNLVSYKSHPCFFNWLWANDINKGFFGCEFLFLTCHFHGTFSDYPIK